MTSRESWALSCGQCQNSNWQFSIEYEVRKSTTGEEGGHGWLFFPRGKYYFSVSPIENSRSFQSLIFILFTLFIHLQALKLEV